MGQNPEFHVTPTSGLLDLLYVAREQFSRGEEFKAQERSEMEQAFAGFCRGGLEGYAAAITTKPWLLDKSRGFFFGGGALRLPQCVLFRPQDCLHAARSR